MADPFTVLGISPDSDDDTIRRRYLELVRQFPPEHHPGKFAEVRQAYESLKDLDTRLRSRLFGHKDHETIDQIIEEIQCQSSRRRHSLKDLIQIYRET